MFNITTPKDIFNTAIKKITDSTKQQKLFGGNFK